MTRKWPVARQGRNPETGPFYIESAEAGDTLVVKLNRIRLNRDSAFSGDRVIPDATTSGYHRNANYEDRFDAEWKLDREAGWASLAKPTAALKNYKVKLNPFLGCVAVAPPDKQSFRTRWLGSWGGNMDYDGLTEGTTLYLPVNQDGALLFVGDGHAAQGDGELTGDALETSMDGTAIRYDIAEIVDPQVHIVAKISKASLAGLVKQ